MNTAIHTLTFSINNWDHLYSLQAAIQHNRQHTGRSLSINGRILNQTFLAQQDTSIHIRFLQSADTPDYPLATNQMPMLGQIHYADQQLSSEITVDPQVFEELRKNLMEYADIDGIHIMVTIGVISEHDSWQQNSSLQLIQLDYAMKGDA